MTTFISVFPPASWNKRESATEEIARTIPTSAKDGNGTQRYPENFV